MPEEGAELHPATAALQALQWDDEEDTPLGRRDGFSLCLLVERIVEFRQGPQIQRRRQ